MTLYENRRGPYLLTTDKSRLQLDLVHGFLSGAYWSTDIPRATVERAIANSLCFGLYHGAAQVGFARVVSDMASFAYLSDVFILPEQRGRGLGKWMIAEILACPLFPSTPPIRRWLLATADAHGLYAQVGFQPLRAAERYMEIVAVNPYATPAPAAE